jgi:DNA-directed RNA polymerase subunit K/omega
MENRFLLCSIAFHRTRQLKDGARPRLAADGHKATHIAVQEVLADAISWSRAEAEA